MCLIFSTYIIQTVLPVIVNILPPLYYPKIGLGITHELVFAVSVIIIFLAVLLISIKRNKKLFFFLGWTAIMFIPVSNIIPLANPMAHRFWYMPSIGIISGLASLFILISDKAKKSKEYNHLGEIVIYGYIAACVIITLSMSMAWQKNSFLAKEWIKHYPDHYKGYCILGIASYREGNCAEAITYSEKCLEYGPQDPRISNMIGMCLLKAPEKAKAYFLATIKFFPHYAPAYRGMGRVYYIEGSMDDALTNFRKALDLEKSFPNYRDIIIALIHYHRYDEANDFLRDAAQYLTYNDLEKLREVVNIKQENKQ